MNILYIDAISGISGNMFIGAMLDLIEDKDFLIEGISKLDLEGYELDFKRLDKNGISANYFNVILKEKEPEREIVDKYHTVYKDEDVIDLTKSDFYKPEEHSHIHEHSHDHGLDNDHNHEQIHHHGHDHSHSHGHEHEDHRNYRDIEKIIKDSELSDFVKEKSLEIFEYIAHAEGKIHNKPFEDVHFHEVGAIDSIIDAVGAALCVEKLNVDKIIASDIPLGSGFVNCAHGKFPVPAPAAMEILANINAPVYQNNIKAELTTPTGAAIIAAFVDEFGKVPAIRIEKSAYGAGSADLEIPNVLRVYYGKKKD